MKKDWIRATLATPDWCLESCTRYPALRLRRLTPIPASPIPSYSWFGSFDARGIDLNCSRNAQILVYADGIRQIFNDMQPGAVLRHKSGRREDILFRYHSQEKKELLLHIQPHADGFSLTACSRDFPPDTRISLKWRISGLFEPLSLSGNHVRYYSPAWKTGLDIQAEESCTAAFEKDGEDWFLQFSGDARGGMNINCRVMLQPSLPDGPPRFVSPDSISDFIPVSLAETPKWEVTEMQKRGWKPSKGAAREKVAGLFVGDPRWSHHHKSCADRAGDIDYVENTFLDLVIESQAFDAIGLSRDGITEFHREAQWMNLISRTKRAGLRAYMKPGDQELEALNTRQDRIEWVRRNFDVDEARQPDVLRLCWEAVLLSWTTADLCAPPKYFFADHRALRNRPWHEVEDKIVGGMADHFSFFIDSVRRYAPEVTVDLECGDSRVFEKLLGRHENLGVMFMCYGQMPRIKEYLDLYESIARRQLHAERIVLETDCYYTAKYHQIEMLLIDPPEKMYSAEDLYRMESKHSTLVDRDVDATWSWGLNLCHSPEKFDAVCRGVGSRTSRPLCVCG